MAGRVRPVGPRAGAGGRRGSPDGPGGEAGLALVEATVGTCLLIFAALLSLQVALVFHGALAARTAANHSARAYALTRDEARAQAAFQGQRGTTLGLVRLDLLGCRPAGPVGMCHVQATVPVVLPGAGIFGGRGATGPLAVVEVGAYPWGLYGQA